LTSATHLRGGRVFLDIVINHTGWGSTLQENHPEYYVRNPDGTFASPGAWGTTWEDLVENQTRERRALGRAGRDVFDLVPPRRGRFPLRCRLQSAAFRLAIHQCSCPTEVSRNHFPARGTRRRVGNHRGPAHGRRHAMGLFGTLSKLLWQRRGTLSGLQSAPKRARGLYVHYSETHDNDRLAKRGRAWSLFAKPTLRSREHRRRLRFHLRCRMAGDGKKSRSTAAPAWRGATRTTSCPNSRN